MNCFQHIPESRGAIAKPPRGGATKKKADFTTQHALIGFKHPHLPQSSALHNRTCPCPLTSDRTRNARAPTSPRSIGFCAIWESISSSSSSSSGMCWKQFMMFLEEVWFVAMIHLRFFSPTPMHDPGRRRNSRPCDGPARARDASVPPFLLSCCCWRRRPPAARRSRLRAAPPPGTL